MEAATAAGVYIPHLCHHPEYTPHGSCKLCTVKVNGRTCSACTFPAMEGQDVLNNTKELNDDGKKSHKCCLLKVIICALVAKKPETANCRQSPII